MDIEFTVNYLEDRLKLNLVQCRPLQTRGADKMRQNAIPKNISENKLFIRMEGNFMGGSINQEIRRVIYIHPDKYSSLGHSDKYEVARIIGRINGRLDKNLPALLLSPGRLGSSLPALGVPVSFSEINNFSVLGEVAFTSGELMPELSFGSHFFMDLVEADIFYIAVFPDSRHCIFNTTLLKGKANALGGLVPGAELFCDTIQVWNTQAEYLKLKSDIISQELVCFLEESD